MYLQVPEKVTKDIASDVEKVLRTFIEWRHLVITYCLLYVSLDNDNTAASLSTK